MTEAQTYAARIIRNYGHDRAGMLRMIERLEAGNSESWTIEECALIAAALRAALN